jgi:hypothetical protein
MRAQWGLLTTKAVPLNTKVFDLHQLESKGHVYLLRKNKLPSEHSVS